MFKFKFDDNLRKIRLFLSLFAGIYFLLFIQGCEQKRQNKYGPTSRDRRMFILNTGTIGVGGASVSCYLPKEMMAFNDFFFKNSDRRLGGAASSMVIRDGLLYVSMMRPGKIHMIDLNTFKWIKSSHELHNPCALHFANDEKIYVTHVGDTIISIFQPKTMMTLGRIDMCESGFEICKKGFGDRYSPMVSGDNMITYENLVFVTMQAPVNKILIIDPLIDVIVDVIDVRENPVNMQIDKNDKLWVLHASWYSTSFPKPYLTRIDIKTRKIEFEIPLQSRERAQCGSLALNPTKDMLYWTADGHLWKMPVTSRMAPMLPFIPSLKEKYFFGVSIDPENREIYLADIHSFEEPGVIYRYSESGDPIDFQEVGIVPKTFVFQ